MSTPRLSGISIDCDEDSFTTGVGFWSGAFAATPVRAGDESDPYVTLDGAIPGLSVEVQRVGSPSRFHIDFEAEDVEAEVERFVELGAERVEKIDTWWVMKAPTGHLFCVVPAG